MTDSEPRQPPALLSPRASPYAPPPWMVQVQERERDMSQVRARLARSRAAFGAIGAASLALDVKVILTPPCIIIPLLIIYTKYTG